MDDLGSLHGFANQLRVVAAHLGTLETDGDPGSHPVLVTSAGRSFTFAQTLAEIRAAGSHLDGEILTDPDDDFPVQGLLRLFSVHREEALETAPPGARTLRVVSYGVIAE